MLDWIKNIFKRDKKKVGAVVEPSKPWPNPQPKLTLHERYEAPNQRPKPTPNPHKQSLPPKREGVYFNHPNQQANNDDNFLLGVVVGAATNSGSSCDSGSSWDSGSSYDSGSSCDCGGSCGD